MLLFEVFFFWNKILFLFYYFLFNPLTPTAPETARKKRTLNKKFQLQQFWSSWPKYQFKIFSGKQNNF